MMAITTIHQLLCREEVAGVVVAVILPEAMKEMIRETRKMFLKQRRLLKTTLKKRLWMQTS